MTYLYRHIRLDRNEVFYVGISNDGEGEYERAYCTRGRSDFWENIVNVTNYIVEIVLDTLTWEEAVIKEKEFIKLYGRRNLKLGTLVNLTDGGEGIPGHTHSKITRQKISKAGKNRVCSKETRAKFRLIAKSRIYPRQFGEKISASKKASKFNKQKKTILNITTGIYYYSVLEAAEAYNIVPSTLYQKLRGERTNNTDLIII